MFFCIFIAQMVRHTIHYKSSELYSVLHAHFGKSMNLARIKADQLDVVQKLTDKYDYFD